jgi:hypothetical protein
LAPDERGSGENFFQLQIQLTTHSKVAPFAISCGQKQPKKYSNEANKLFSGILFYLFEAESLSGSRNVLGGM